MKSLCSVHILKTQITTQFYQRSRIFYKDILGLSVIEEWHHEHDTGCIFEITSSAQLELHKGTTKALSGFSLQFQVNNLNGFMADLNNRWPFEGPVSRPWGAHYLYLLDPNGISIILFSKNY